jgi:thiol-disulfide isomerase/thioredoxin
MKKVSVLLSFVLMFTALHAVLAFTTSGGKLAADDNVHFVNPKKADGSEKTFQEIIAEFKGKVVYVDFWATWCGPCRQQFPHAKEVHKNLAGKEVVFLYISFDRTEAEWKKGIDNLKIYGHHLYPTQKQQQAIYQQFQVTGIPRYMLIDKKGNVVNPDAKRPSAREALVDDIKKLL